VFRLFPIFSLFHTVQASEWFWLLLVYILFSFSQSFFRIMLEISIRRGGRKEKAASSVR
jgi:hypothetical protein